MIILHHEQCYSGWRPQELCLLKISDVDLDNECIRKEIRVGIEKKSKK